MNPLERSVWMMFVFIVNIFLIVFIFLAESAYNSQAIGVDDKKAESVAETPEETEIL